MSADSDGVFQALASGGELVCQVMAEARGYLEAVQPFVPDAPIVVVVTPRQVTVRLIGDVRDEYEYPVQRVEMCASFADGDRSPIIGWTAVSSEEGDFSLDLSCSTTSGAKGIWLEVRSPGYVQRLVGPIEFESAAREARLSIRLLRAQRLRGRVLSTVGRPVAGAEISAYARSRGKVGSAESDGAGMFEVPVDPSDTVESLYVGASRFAPRWLRGEELRHWMNDLEIVLGEGCVVHGIVERGDGSPVGGATVELWTDDEREMGLGWWPMWEVSVTADENGRYAVPLVPAGSVFAVAAYDHVGERRSSELRRFNTVEGGRLEVNWVFGWQSYVSGRVELPMPDAVVWLELYSVPSPDGGPAAEVLSRTRITSGSGFVLTVPEGFPAGPCRIRLYISQEHFVDRDISFPGHDLVPS
ncbi:MAG: carboxypeptidase regulatory-like domain-containing protein [Planctomycetes bacterium]|nr:carboxypeptidase regulatory-like domain-containing protein [Planctomycetota bacterium]